MVVKILLVLVGGGVGSVLRFLVSGWAQSLNKGAFPVGTLTVNGVGCLLVGLAGAVLLARDGWEHWRLAVMIGLLGGFTTFSTFAWETMALAGEGHYRAAVGNVVLGNAVCLVFAFVGFRVGQQFFGG